MSEKQVIEKIVLKQEVATEKMQLLMEGDLIVPDNLPDIGYVLRSDAKFLIDQTDVSDDRVNIHGRLVVNTLYVSMGVNKTVHNMKLVTDVDEFIHMEDLRADMQVSVVGSIINMDYGFVNDRKLNYRGIMDLSVKASQSESWDIISNLDEFPLDQQKKGSFVYNKQIEQKKDRFVVKDTLQVLDGKPNIAEILETRAMIGNYQNKVLNGHMQVEGEIMLTVLYKGHDNSLIELLEYEMPFNGSIDAPKASQDMQGTVILEISDLVVKAIANEDGEDRNLETEISVLANMEISMEAETTILEDAYSLEEQIEIEKEIITYPRVIATNHNQFQVKEVIVLDDLSPDIFQVLQVSGDVSVDMLKVEKDQVHMEGLIVSDALYIAKDDQEPVFNERKQIPFAQIIETRGAVADMDANVRCKIDHIGFNMLSDREMEIRFLISAHSTVTDVADTVVATDIIFSAYDENWLESMPSMTIYIVEDRDSLWDIARRFHTTIDDLMAVNELDDSLLHKGQRLLIIKNA